MPQLSQKARESLPDSAFAYIDSTGRRRLPINDEAHVRNALARFNQTTFEDEAARDRSRTRLLKAAKKYAIVPVGFMTGQFRSQSSAAMRLAVENEQMRSEIGARASEVRSLPSGSVTFPACRYLRLDGTGRQPRRWLRSAPGKCQATASQCHTSVARAGGGRTG